MKYAFIKFSAMVKMWHKGIFKRSRAGLTSGFTFSTTNCRTKAKEPKQIQDLDVGHCVYILRRLPLLHKSLLKVS